MLYTIFVLTALCAYLLGSVNTSIILSKSIYGDDIRSSGSGNAGATNMLRTHGKGIAIATLICDVLKGTLAVVLATWLDLILTSHFKDAALSANERMYLLGNLKYVAGVFVVLGHDFPLYFGFRGGKGVATSLGVILALNWQVGLIVLAAALIVMAFSRYVSLGSITAAGIYPFILFTYIIASGENLEDSVPYLIMAFILALLLIIKHHSNITKLRNGTENKLFAKRKTEETAQENTGDQ
ncbi:MAG: glycerol-3-phosphate 1-O-acyltransferase PlsY [Clostridiales bacterium]|nr:glycerol-3-phosphate 1-O-acyltransferase PlsY [Clostridiales bacterium]